MMYVPRYYRFNKQHRTALKNLAQLERETGKHSSGIKINIQNLRSANEESKVESSNLASALEEGSEIQDEAHLLKNINQGFKPQMAKPIQPDRNEMYEQTKAKNLESFNRKYDNRRISHFIPALHLPFKPGSSKVMIYFHANAEDVVLSHELLDYMRALLRISIIAVEYPGYGLYTEGNQKRYNYPKPINPNLKQRFIELKQQKQRNRNSKNYAKEARVGGGYFSEDSDGISAMSDGNIEFED